MKRKVPEFLEHLPIQSGYPVPYFSFRERSGKYLIHILDTKKQMECLKKGICAVCGKPIKEKPGFLITGPQGLNNRVCTDTFMHEQCARYSLEICPHMHFWKTERREIDERAVVPSYFDPKKPTELILVKAADFQVMRVEGKILINYYPIAVQHYHYIENRLTPADLELKKLPANPFWRHTGVPLVKL